MKLDLDGTGQTVMTSTRCRFYDHILTALSRHSLIGMEIEAIGDVEVDAHHSGENTAIALSTAIRQALVGKIGIRRFGDATVGVAAFRPVLGICVGHQALASSGVEHQSGDAGARLGHNWMDDLATG